MKKINCVITAAYTAAWTRIRDHRNCQGTELAFWHNLIHMSVSMMTFSTFDKACHTAINTSVSHITIIYPTFVSTT